MSVHPRAIFSPADKAFSLVGKHVARTFDHITWCVRRPNRILGPGLLRDWWFKLGKLVYRSEDLVVDVTLNLTLTQRWALLEMKIMIIRGSFYAIAQWSVWSRTKRPVKYAPMGKRRVSGVNNFDSRSTIGTWIAV